MLLNTIGIFFTLISRRPPFFRGNTTISHPDSVVVQLPPDIGLPPWMVGLCLRPVYGLNDAPRRWWNRLDKFLRSVGMEPTRADRYTYVAHDGIEGKKDKNYLSTGSFLSEKEPEPEPPGYLKDLALHATSCYAYDEESRTASDRAEERSYMAYMSCPDIAQCFNTETTRWSTMLGDRLPMGSFWVSWAASRVRREDGSL